jgi:hypothetical protein
MNLMLFFKISINCKIGNSRICNGLGLYAMDDIVEGRLIVEYLG